MTRMPAAAATPSSWLELLREHRYRKHFLRSDARLTAAAMGAAVLGVVGVMRNDFILLRGTRLLAVTVVARLVFGAVVSVAAIVVLRARWPRQHDRLVWTFCALLSVVGGGVILTRFPSGEIQGPVVGLFAYVGVLLLMMRGRVLPRALACGMASLSTAVVLWSPRAAASSPSQLTGTVAIVIVNVVGVVAARAAEEQRRKRFEAERRERIARVALAAEKERAEALARARAAFLAAMSHEFRTPMNAVIGLSDLLLAELRPGAAIDEEGVEHIRAIHDSARALLVQLNDILDFAKIDAQKLALSPAPFHLPRLAASVTDMLRPTAEARGLELTLAVAPGVPEHVAGDDARVRQVLVNLVSNAVKFTRQGSVRLEVGSQAVSGPEHEVTFRVIDTGPGIPKEALGGLFQPFVQLDSGRTRRHGGSGLGLAISRQIVQAMGGDIHVESEPGRGATFSFTLRLAEAEAPEVEARALPAARADRPPLAILVVDDDLINRLVARASLRRLGYSVDVVSSGPEAIGAVARKEYDVVFMDLQMPGMSGIEVTRRMHETLVNRRMPHIVALSASVLEEDREACRAAGMRDFAAKPIDLAQIDEVLARVAEERAAPIPRPAVAPVQGGAAGATLAADKLEALRRIEAAGEESFVAEVSRIFRADSPGRVRRIEEALRAGDADAIQREAHVLKSSSATIGATELSALCARIEDLAGKGELAGLASPIEALPGRLEEAARALEEALRAADGAPSEVSC